MSEPDLRVLAGRRMAVVSFSAFPGDPRPRRAAEAFASAGMHVEVICLRDAGSMHREIYRGIRVDRVAIRKSRTTKLWYVLQYVLFLSVAFLKLSGRSLVRRYDIVHVHNMPDVLIFAALVPKLFGAKLILDLHDPMPELMMTIFGAGPESRAINWMARLERWSIAFADVVLTVNRACERLFKSRGASPEKIHVVMNSPDESIFTYTPVQVGRAVKPDGERDRRFVVMYHGTLVERNGLDVAIAALAKVKRFVPHVELRVYGTKTPFLDEAMRIAAAQGLQDHVGYFGSMRLEELSEAIKDCDVGVIPNKRSIFTEINTPTRIFEYLALGKAVLAPRAPGIQDYFPANALVYFELGDVDELAQKLIWIATHPNEAAQVTEHGQAVYLQHSWATQKATLLTTAAELLSNRVSRFAKRVA